MQDTAKADKPRVDWAEMPPWVHFAVWALFAAITAALLVVFYAYRDVNVWANWRASGGLEDPNYAERIYRESVFRTRSNTWSNLFFVLAGLYPLMLGIHDWRRKSGRQNHLTANPAMSILFGLACCYLGFGSGLFHASLTRWGQRLDVAAMYSPLVVLIAHNLVRWMPRVRGVPAWPGWAALAIVSSALLYVYKWEMSSKEVLPALILAVAAFALVDPFVRAWRVAFRWLGVAFIMLAIGVVCRQTGVAGHFSGPDTWLQGHAFWHLFTAACLGAMYCYYRSETLAPASRADRRR